MRELELQPGEELCPKCKGTGDESGTRVDGFRLSCERCWGEGKLDWVEMAMQKPNRFPVFSTNPCADVDLYYAGTKILETTENGVVIYAN